MKTNKFKNTSKQRSFTFNLEADGHWYLYSPEYEEFATDYFRSTHTYLDNYGKIQKYARVRDYTEPLDDHTLNPDWVDPHTYLKISGSLESLLKEIAGNQSQVIIDTIAYGFVSNTFVHYKFEGNNEKGDAIYRIQYKSAKYNLPEVLEIPRIGLYFFDGSFPLVLNGQRIQDADRKQNIDD